MLIQGANEKTKDKRVVCNNVLVQENVGADNNNSICSIEAVKKNPQVFGVRCESLDRSKCEGSSGSLRS